MKIVIISFFFSCVICGKCFGQLKSQTCETFELSSIAFRLAGAEEYINNVIPAYTQDIDVYFAPYVEHDLIAYIKEIRKDYGIGYDAVMNAAACLTINNGDIVVKSDFDVSDIGKVDPRWTADAYIKYVTRLNNFYKASRFNKFYNAHKPLYNVATKRLDRLLNQINIKWFESFFGKELRRPTIVASLSNGRANYAYGITTEVTPPGIVIGCSAAKGLPIYSAYSTLPLIVHELSHGYSNALLENAWDDSISPAVMEIYSNVEEKMLEIGYGDPGIMLTEWFNNLCELMYFRENPSKSFDMNRRIARYQYRGFIWMERSVDFMDEFYENRSTFVTIKDYIPRLFVFINKTASDFKKVIEENNHKVPYVVETSPVSGTVLNSDKLVVKFSTPMFTHAYGMEKINEPDILLVPIKKEYWLNSTTFVIEIDTKKLQKNKKYGIQLHRQFFQSDATYPLATHFNYLFLTAK